jgi:hypothetical protein
MNKNFLAVSFLVMTLAGLFILRAQTATSQSSFSARDPGVRGGSAGAGGAYENLTQTQLAFFQAGQEDFAEEETVADGLGPTMNLDGCGPCHSQPALGGTSPFVNPQIAMATKNGASNLLPSFITSDGPVREARFVRNRMERRMAESTLCSLSPDERMLRAACWRSRISLRRLQTTT